MAPRRRDVESIDGVVKALYESISGPAGPRECNIAQVWSAYNATTLCGRVQVRDHQPEGVDLLRRRQ